MFSETYPPALLSTTKTLQTRHASDSVDVAFLGNVLLKEGKHWKQHGFDRLSLALAELERLNLARLFRSEKDALRVRALPVGSDSVGETLESSVFREAAKFVPLRKSVWFVFSVNPTGEHRLFNRRTGILWRHAVPPPGPESDWLPVTAVSEEVQKQWARDFVRTSDIADKDALNLAIGGPEWFQQLQVELAKHGQSTVRLWRHFRSRHIVDHVKAWAKQHNVDDRMLFEGQSHATASARDLRQNAVEGDDLREALLNVLGRMQTEELLALRLPARALIEVIRPDLLR